MWPNREETADLVTFTEEILNGKLHFLCNACAMSDNKTLFIYGFHEMQKLHRRHAPTLVLLYETHRRIQNPLKHLRWSVFAKKTLCEKSTDYAKALHLRCLKRLSIRLCNIIGQLNTRFRYTFSLFKQI